MTTYEEFKELIREKAETEIGGRATIHTMHKNNGVKLDALVIMTMECNISPSIYLNSFYKEYMECTNREGALEEIWGEIKQTYFNNIPNESIDTDCILDFSRVRGRIHMKIVNREKNKELLEQLAYIPYLDLAIVFTIAMIVEDCEMATITVRRDFMETWGVDESELWNIACENMAEDFEVISMYKLLEEYNVMAAKNCLDIDMYVMTNHSRVQGAVTMVQPGVMCKVAEELDAEKLIILPCSVHELILLNADNKIDTDFLNIKVREVNKNGVLPEEVLSDHVYIYDKESDEVKIA